MSAIVQTLPGSVEIEGAEELLMSGEEAAEEAKQPEQVGFLTSNEGKHYVFIPQNQTPLSQKCSEYFENKEKPKSQKSFDSKGELRPLSYEDSAPLRQKQFQVQKSEKGEIEQQEKNTASQKSDQSGRTALQEGAPPLPTRLAPPRSFELRNTFKTSAQTKERTEEQKRDQLKNEKELKREQQSGQTGILREKESAEHNRTREHERKEEEEGFAEDQKQRRQEDPEEEERHKVEAVESNSFDFKEFIDYGKSESALLSQLLEMRVSQFDILFLFFEILKLALEGRAQERLDRMHERELQLQHLESIVQNFKQEGKNAIFSSIGSGVMGILAGMMPVVGYLKGNAILNVLSGFSEHFRRIPSDKFFKSLTTMLNNASEMQKNYGHIQKTFTEGARSYDQQMAELRKTDWEEDTRTMEELKDEWRGIENFLHQTLQMYHDTTRQLYNG